MMVNLSNTEIFNILSALKESDSEILSKFVDKLIESANENGLTDIGSSQTETDSDGCVTFNGKDPDCNDYEFSTYGNELFDLLFNLCADFGSYGQPMDKIAVISGMKIKYVDDDGNRFYWL